jgi:hypothetical protein
MATMVAPKGLAEVIVKGKSRWLSQDIVDGGPDRIRMALAAAYPDAATMEIEVARPEKSEQLARVTERAAAPAVITSRSTAVTKG